MRSKTAARILWAAWCLFLLVRIARTRPWQAALLGAAAITLAVLVHFAKKQDPESPVLIFAPLVAVVGLTLALMLGSLELFIWLSVSAVAGAFFLWLRSRKSAQPVVQP